MLLIKTPEEALFDLGADAISFATVHNRHLPTVNVDKEDGKSEGLAPAVNPSPAKPPCMNPNKEAMRTKESSSATASPPSEEVVGDEHVADGG